MRSKFMANLFSPNPWEAMNKSGSWLIVGKDGKRIATIAQSPSIEKNAKLIAASPYMLEALKGIAELVGDEDLPDNGELSGAAISDMDLKATQTLLILFASKLMNQLKPHSNNNLPKRSSIRYFHRRNAERYPVQHIRRNKPKRQTTNISYKCLN